MERIEFYQFNQELWYKDDNGNHRLEEGAEVVDKLFAFLCEFYPDAISALQKEYRKIEEDKYRMFRIVSRFCKCNFGVADNIYDIGSDKKVNFEYVSCPLRGECKLENVVCCPKFNSKITASEMRVLRLIYKGVSRQDIASQLYLSEKTIHNHVQNAFCRIGVHSITEFIDYANKHGLFEQERFEH